MIYDAFLFFNELDLLEIRLNTLYPIVDKFIISESSRTHSGLPKILFYGTNKDRFKKFEDKIIHQIVTDTPEDYTNLSPDSTDDPVLKSVIEKVNRGYWWPKDHPAYGRDTFEKESLIRAMKNCNPDDIILLSDADEIPNPETLQTVIDNFNPEEVYNFRQNMYYYYLNYLKEDNWLGTTLLSYKKFQENAFCELRTIRRGTVVENGGWHFSYMGGVNRIKQKLESFGEQSLNTQGIKDRVAYNVDNCLTSGQDIFGRPCKFWKVPIDSSYPKYLVENQEKYRDYIR